MRTGNVALSQQSGILSSCVRVCGLGLLRCRNVPGPHRRVVDVSSGNVGHGEFPPHCEAAVAACRGMETGHSTVRSIQSRLDQIRMPASAGRAYYDKKIAEGTHPRVQPQLIGRLSGTVRSRNALHSRIGRGGFGRSSLNAQRRHRSFRAGEVGDTLVD